MIQKILLPLDGSQLAEKALPYAEALAQKFGAELILIWVIQEPVIVPQVDYYGAGMPLLETMIASEEKEATEYLRSLKERFQQQNIPTRTAVLKGHSVADAIIEKASQEGVDVIVKTTHGRSGLSQWIFGNVAAKVLQRAPCPIFLIRVSQEETLD